MVNELIEALIDPEFPFLRYALLAGLMASIPLGVVGSYVVTRRISYIAGAIAHCVLGGVGAGLYLREVVGITWFEPLLGALIAALLAAVTIGLVSFYTREREDTVIGALWAIGMAIGLMFFAKIPVYVDPMNYLFGNIILISKQDLVLVAVLNVLVVVPAVLFYNKFLALCFDEELTALRGVRVKLLYLLLLCLTAITVVLLVRLVGIILVIALLTLPPAISGRFARRLWQMMIAAVAICMLLVSLGLALSYTNDLPSGPTIILLTGGVYLLTLVGGRMWRPHAQ